jgi:Flp pilus assembly CpaF family ATPase
MNPTLATLMTPLNQLLNTKDLVELSVFEAGKVGLEVAGQGYAFIETPHLNTRYWHLLCHALANQQGLVFAPPQQPFLSVALPGGHRFQAKMGQGVESRLDISIRLLRPVDIPLEKFGLIGDLQDKILNLIKGGANIIVSGGTSSGKTTFLRQLLKQIPQDKRILTLEDTRELFMPGHPHIIHHLVPRNEGRNHELYGREIDHMMRSRPDVIILGEVSVGNAFPILRLLNSGHAGFMTTIHANTPELALTAAIPQNIRLSGQEDRGVVDVLMATVDLIIQLHKVGLKDRLITEVFFPKAQQTIQLEGNGG